MRPGNREGKGGPTAKGERGGKGVNTRTPAGASKTGMGAKLAVSQQPKHRRPFEDDGAVTREANLASSRRRSDVSAVKRGKTS